MKAFLLALMLCGMLMMVAPGTAVTASLPRPAVVLILDDDPLARRRRRRHYRSAHARMGTIDG